MPMAGPRLRQATPASWHSAIAERRPHARKLACSRSGPGDVDSATAVTGRSRATEPKRWCSGGYQRAPGPEREQRVGTRAAPRLSMIEAAVGDALGWSLRQ